MTGRPVRLVFDTSAILEFARGSVHVGELLSELSDEHAAAALPVGCLAEALPSAVEPDRIAVLAAHEATVVLADEAESWEALGHMCALTGALGAASVALMAVDLQAWILSARPELYAGIAGGAAVIPLTD